MNIIQALIQLFVHVQFDGVTMLLPELIVRIIVRIIFPALSKSQRNNSFLLSRSLSPMASLNFVEVFFLRLG